MIDTAARRTAVGPVRAGVLVLLLAGAVTLLGGCGGLGGYSAEAAALLALVNEARTTPRDCGSTRFAAAPALVLERRLTRAAQAHSEDMLASGRMSHTGSDGSSVQQRIERQGYAWSTLGENVAWGYPTPASAMAGWLGSAGHCANIMNPAFEELGAGAAEYYWTLDFATPR